MHEEDHTTGSTIDQTGNCALVEFSESVVDIFFCVFSPVVPCGIGYNVLNPTTLLGYVP